MLKPNTSFFVYFGNLTFQIKHSISSTLKANLDEPIKSVWRQQNSLLKYVFHNQHLPLTEKTGWHKSSANWPSHIIFMVQVQALEFNLTI